MESLANLDSVDFDRKTFCMSVEKVLIGLGVRVRG